ncbi:MAG: tetratricopeptide repeat protein [Verrucomicrobiia bacterium]
MKNAWRAMVGVCAVVIGVYAGVAQPGVWASGSLNIADDYYNLLVQGFRAGQLSLKKEVPPRFAQPAAPYDWSANAYYEVNDLSYYKGKLYLYFGVTPAVVLFWPYVALTGHYLSQKVAGVIFCVVGFLVSVGLLCALWRRYFAEVSVAVVVAGAFALGLATFTPLLLARCDVYEISISCGYALTMLALAAIWKALHHPSQRGWWLAVASLAYGLAVGARPNLLFGALALLVPVAQAWRERRQVGAVLTAATVPITLIGLGLMLYNALRFNNPFEFGQHYQLNGNRQITAQLFSLRYLWFNFRVYFLEPAHWSSRWPFVHDISVRHLPVGQGGVEHPFGVLANIPLVWLALAVPLAWRGRSVDVRYTLCRFLAAVVVLFGICTLTLGLYFGAASRYEVEFLPALVLLAVIGMLSLERALAPTSESGQACRPVWRRAARCGWGLILGFSVAFNLLAGVKYSAESHSNLGDALARTGSIEGAIAQYQRALRINPDYAQAHCALGMALAQAGKPQEAIREYEYALQLEPDFADAHVSLGVALEKLGRLEDAIRHYEEALRIKSDDTEAHVNLGNALLTQGNARDAMAHYEEALRINPDSAEAHINLGNALLTQGRGRDAIAHYEAALRLKPDSAKAHMSLGSALLVQGRVPEAIRRYEEALRLKPDSAEAHDNLGIALAQARRLPEAMEHWEEALKLKPDDVEAHVNLGNALQGQGRLPEAIEHYQQALKLRPDFLPAKNALIRLQPSQ